jgi:hypothetical protein
MKFAKALVSGVGAAAVLALVSPAWAQGDYYDDEDDSEKSDSDDEYDSDSSDTEGSAEASGSASVSSDGLSGTFNQSGSADGGGGGTAPAVAGGSDHSKYVGTFGIGYMGYRTMNIGVDPGDPNNVAAVESPIIGLRYWLSEDMGFDVGLGLVMASRSVDVDGTDTDDPQPFGLLIHGGVPLALSTGQHFVFEVTPELNVGLASNTVEVGMEDLDQSGFHLDIGARAGGEIHFGFIDIPEVALQAGIGLRYSMDSTTAEIDSDNTASSSSSRFETTVGDNPWSIFFANIAALYYFDR